MARNLKPLQFDDGEYAWDYYKAINVLDQYIEITKTTKKAVYDALAEQCFLTPDATKNWFVRKNGPGEPDYVLKMADYFGVDYHCLLNKIRSKEKEAFMDDMFEGLAEDMFLSDGAVQRTVKFIGLLNELAAYTANGYIGFSEYVQKVRDGHMDGQRCNRIVYDDGSGSSYGKIVADMCVDQNHNDIVSTYDQVFNHGVGEKYKLVFRDEDPDEPFLELTDGKHFYIVIENGQWYAIE